MKVFNLYKKLFKSYAIIVIIYVSIFLGLAIVVSFSNEQSSNAYTETRVSVSLNNLDEDSTLSKGLVEYLNKFVDYKEIKEEEISDALYFRQIYSYITIPEDFEAKLIAGDNVKIVQERIEENGTSIAIDRAINKYLNYVRAYLNQTDKNLEEVVVLVNNVLEEEVEAITLVEESDQLLSSGFYFRMLSYIVSAVVLTVVGMITISFRKFDVRRRLIVSPYPTKNANLDMLFGNLLFTLALATLLSVVAILIYPEAMFTTNGLLLIINTFVFSLAALSMSYFMSLLIKNEQVLSGVNNVYSLGSAFLAGAFVPQMLLSSGILTFAHILPNYYFVYNVDLIISTANLSSANINKIILFLIIQVLFAMLFVVLTVVLSKKQTRSEA